MRKVNDFEIHEFFGNNTFLQQFAVIAGAGKHSAIVPTFGATKAVKHALKAATANSRYRCRRFAGTDQSSVAPDSFTILLHLTISEAM